MRPAAHIQATIELFESITTTGKPADRCIRTYFRQRRYIGSKDKQAISENIYTLLRHKLSFTYLLQKASNIDGYQINARLLCMVLLKQRGDKPEDFFNGELYSPAVLNNEELSIINTIDFSLLESAPLHVRVNIPEWLAQKLIPVFGDHFEAEMQAINQRASTDIRVNTLHSHPATILEQLLTNYSVTATPVSPWGLRFSGRVSLLNEPLYRNGSFDIQDEGSQLLAWITGAKAGDKVIDYCAGAGGKTLAMAAMMNNQGCINACDIDSKRLEELSRRCKRAGISNTQTYTLTNNDHEWVAKHKNQADIVLVDAPCSGSGTWRRNPDSRWNLTQQSLQKLLITQQAILQQASQLVKPGGQIFYASCSLLTEENEVQVNTFLANNSAFEPGQLAELDILKKYQHKFDITDNQLRTYPKRSNMDGFFICALRKKSNPETTVLRLLSAGL